MLVIGISQSHCSTACLMRDGEIIGMISEERLTKRKNQVAFPLLAIQELINEHLDGDFSKVNRVVYAGNKINPVGIALDRYSDYTMPDHIDEQHKLWQPYFYENGKSPAEYWKYKFDNGFNLNKDHNHDLEFIKEMKWEDACSHFSNVERISVIERHFGWTGEVATLDHHTSHAYYALYGQDIATEYKNVLILTADAWGDEKNWSTWSVNGDGSIKKYADGTEHLVANIYKYVTLILGMLPNQHEYKVMGLAPFSQSTIHIKEAENILFEALDFRNGEFVSEKPIRDTYFDLRQRFEGHRFDNIAAALQNWAGSVTKSWAKHWLDISGKTELCFSGGLSMNIRLNSELLSLPNVESMNVPASGGDESICAGACFGVSVERKEKVYPIRHAYLGGKANISNWKSRLQETEMDESEFVLLDGISPKKIAQLLKDDCIIARCVGNAEFGARALGNRSILANPAKAENVAYINNAIKNRDFWMPFTPSILMEYASRYLINPKEINSPFMTIGFNTKKMALDDIPAGLHIADKSARPQFVNNLTNPMYWKLIEEFRKLTGIPALLNTSLNLHGEPMNYSVSDAVRTLVKSELKYLSLPDDKLLLKKSAFSEMNKIFDKYEE